MWQEDRYTSILDLLSSIKQVKTDRIVDELGVSRETVRRDLIELEAQGKLKRVHGGAVKIQVEPPLTERVQTRVRFKKAIARRAVCDIKRGQTVYVDAGSTTAILAQELAKLADITVLTNSFDVALRMNVGRPGARHGNRVIVMGGSMENALPATYGEITIAEIHRYRVDMALLSPVGIDAAAGATSFAPREAEIARAMANNAESVVILADHSKIGLISRVSYCSCERIDHLITDSRAREQPGFKQLQHNLARVSLTD